MTLRDIGIAGLIMLLWGVNFGFAKIGLAEFPPILLMALRFGLVALILVPFIRRPGVSWAQVIGLSCTLGALHFALFFSGLNGLDASAAAIVVQLQVPISVLLSVVLLGERPGWRSVVGIVLAFARVWIIFAGKPMSGHLLPLILMISAACVWSGANFQLKAMGNVDGMALNGWMALFATPQLLIASLAIEHGQISAILNADWWGVVSIVFMSVFSTIIAYGLWYRLVHKYPMSLVMPFTLLGPVFGVASGVVWLGEKLTIQLIVGSLMTMAGVATIVLRPPRAAEPANEIAPRDAPRETA